MFRTHEFGWLLLAAAAPFALAADPAAQPVIGQSAPVQAASAQKAAGAPPRMVALFVKRRTCPDGWQLASNTFRRLIVATNTGGNVGVSVGGPMSLSRAPGHEHAVSFSISLASKSLAAANGGSNNAGASNGTRRGTATAADNTSNLPFFGYLACTAPLGGAQ